MNYSFDIDIATKYDVNVAIFLNNIAFWTKTNHANDHNYHDGYYWTYNTLKAFTVIFPFWNVRQIRTIIQKCIDAELLIKGNYNKSKNEQMLWYALTKKGLEAYGLLICQNRQMHVTKMSNACDENVKSTITDINTDRKPEREKPPSQKPICKKISKSFKPSQKHLEFCKEFDLDIKSEKQKFVDHFISTGEKRAKWLPEFSNWLRRSVEYKSKNVLQLNPRKPGYYNQQTSFQEPVRPKYRDFTQERLEREERGEVAPLREWYQNK